MLYSQYEQRITFAENNTFTYVVLEKPRIINKTTSQEWTKVSHGIMCAQGSFTWNSESNDLGTPCLHPETPSATLVPTGGRKLGQQNIPWGDLFQCLCYPLSCLACLILYKIMLFTAHQVLLGTANDLLCKEVNFNMIFNRFSVLFKRHFAKFLLEFSERGNNTFEFSNC